MAKTPNFEKLLLDGLKSDGVKPTRKESPSKRDFRVLVDAKTVAHIERKKEGALRVYVRAETLPKALAKSFTKTKNSGYALTIEDAETVGVVVEAILTTAKANAV